MNDNKDGLTKEEVEMYLRALIEEPIKANDLLAEILPLIEECIIADFELAAEGIVMKMLNGQKFKITVEEIQFLYLEILRLRSE